MYIWYCSFWTYGFILCANFQFHFRQVNFLRFSPIIRLCQTLMLSTCVSVFLSLSIFISLSAAFPCQFVFILSIKHSSLCSNFLFHLDFLDLDPSAWTGFFLYLPWTVLKNYRFYTTVLTFCWDQIVFKWKWWSIQSKLRKLGLIYQYNLSKNLTLFCPFHSKFSSSNDSAF